MAEYFSITLGEAAKFLGAQLEGDESRVVSGIRPLEMAESSDLSFLAPSAKKMTAHLTKLARQTRAGAVIVRNYDAAIPTSQLIIANPLTAVVTLASKLYERPKPIGIHPTACIHESAVIGTNCKIGAYAVIGEGVKLGENCIVHPHVVIYPGVQIGSNSELHSGSVVREHVIIGDDCLLQPGVVLGGDGFGYASDREHGHRRIPHIGNVVLEDAVDLGANATVDRATFGETRIGTGSKIDNLVMLGHNVKLGKRVLLCSQVGISGSSTIGDNVILAGKVGVADHIHVADGVRAAALTGIDRDVEIPGIDIAGMPWIDAKSWRRVAATWKRLPEIWSKIRAIERKLGL